MKLPKRVQQSVVKGMDKFLWASPHTPTQEQLTQLCLVGEIVYLSEVNEDLMKDIMENTLTDNLRNLATRLWVYCFNCHYILVQPGGSPALQYNLGQVQIEMSKKKECEQIPIMWSFSKRVSEDIKGKDDKIIKASIFKHEGWIS